MIKINGRLGTGLAAIALVLVFWAAPSPAAAEGFVPLITMADWQKSSEAERYAFLAGFGSMLEAEKHWQNERHGQLLPFEDSLIGSWSRGFKKLRLKDVYKRLNEYLAENPQDLQRPLVEVMWFEFAQPTVKEKISRSEAQ